MIHLLSDETINQIAAGEVIERPASVVKELVENSIDAGADVITVEIRGGGISLIRVTDNGRGIGKDDLSVAFLRHATSKIFQAEDLKTIRSLGFRGEALSSIAAVSRLEVISKTADSLSARHVMLEGGTEILNEEIGAPDGCTFVVRDLFYNTPARKKFLKSEGTEGSYVYEYVERLSLSHPEIAFRFIQNGRNRIQTAGTGKLADAVYEIFGRELSGAMMEVSFESGSMKLSGLLGKPEAARGNRTFEYYFINGRYIRNSIVGKAVEEAYRPYLMQHKYPICILSMELPPDEMDVNVHPAKMEVRFQSPERVYDFLLQGIAAALSRREWIRSEAPGKEITSKSEKTQIAPVQGVPLTNLPVSFPEKIPAAVEPPVSFPEPFETRKWEKLREESPMYQAVPEEKASVQLDLFEERILTTDKTDQFRWIGQLFSTYWLVEYEGRFLMIDQHAAHEKIMYEKLMKMFRDRTPYSQILSPPRILHLGERESSAVEENRDMFTSFGFRLEPFGGNDYAVTAVPADMPGFDKRDVLMEMISELSGTPVRMKTPESVGETLASMACKAAVKGNQTLSEPEARAMVKGLLKLDNPYFCPHGRPVIISMDKADIERKFKRII